MRVVVVGGGLAGTAVALALRRHGVAVDVYEARGTEDPGAFLTVASNGMLALTQLGVADAVAEVGFALTSMRVLDGQGTELAVRPLDDAGSTVTRYRCLFRADLVSVLREQAVASGAVLHDGRRLVDWTERASGVTARFADGTTADADLLVGADGLWSTVRDPGEVPRYAGQWVCYGHTDDTDAGAPHRFDAYPGDGDCAFGMFRSPGGRVHWYARVTGDELPDGELAAPAPERWRERLRHHVPAGVPASVVAWTGEHLLATNARDLPSVRRWRTDRTLLVGDAAHAASPATGQGASMAFEDAVVLAETLHDQPSLDAALTEYERRRRPRVEENVAASARMTGGDGVRGGSSPT